MSKGQAKWNGPALAGVPGRYAEAQRARLAEVRLMALERRLEIAITLGHHGDVVPELTALVSEHPFRGRTRQLLMLALARSGRRADALAPTFMVAGDTQEISRTRQSATAVLAAPGVGGLVRQGRAGQAGGTSYFLVTDAGVKFPIGTAGVAKALG